MKSFQQLVCLFALGGATLGVGCGQTSPTTSTREQAKAAVVATSVVAQDQATETATSESSSQTSASTGTSYSNYESSPTPMDGIVQAAEWAEEILKEAKFSEDDQEFQLEVEDFEFEDPFAE